jgi:putative tricarboxylic transport membrane protein
MFCIVGVYAVNYSVVDLGIMVVMGVLGYLMKKFDFEAAPVVLGLVLAPILERSLRQALAMSDGSYGILFTKPISLTFLLGSTLLLALSVLSTFQQRSSWRDRLTQAEKEG